MKIKTLKLANAVKVGKNESLFFIEDRYTMTLTQGVVLTITDKRDGSTVCTSLFNAIYWVAADLVADTPVQPDVVDTGMPKPRGPGRPRVNKES